MASREEIFERAKKPSLLKRSHRVHHEEQPRCRVMQIPEELKM
jgi:hypothetical protein